MTRQLPGLRRLPSTNIKRNGSLSSPIFIALIVIGSMGLLPSNVNGQDREMSVSSDTEVKNWAFGGATIIPLAILALGTGVAGACFQGPYTDYMQGSETKLPGVKCLTCCYFFVGFVLVGGLLFRPNLPNPDIGPYTIHTIDLQNLLEPKIDFDIVFIVENPNPYSFELTEVDIDVGYKEDSLGTVNAQGPLTFGAAATSEVTVPFLLDLPLATGLAMYGEYTGEGFDLLVKGAIRVTAGALGIKVPIKIDEAVNIRESDPESAQSGDGGGFKLSAPSPTTMAILWTLGAASGYGLFTYLNQQGKGPEEGWPGMTTTTTKGVGLADFGSFDGGLSNEDNDPDIMMSQATGVTRGSGSRSKGSKASKGSRGSSAGKRSRGSRGSRASKASKGSKASKASKASKGSRGGSKASKGSRGSAASGGKRHKKNKASADLVYV